MGANTLRWAADVPTHTLSREAKNELLLNADATPSTETNTAGNGPVTTLKELSPSLANELALICSKVDTERHALIVNGLNADTVGSFKSLIWTFGCLLGTPMTQDSLGRKMIEVYDRGAKTIEEGARYHQTRQGAYVHNDGVSDPVPIHYLLLACGQKAKFGGESILIDASAVYIALAAYPDILQELRNEFFFENRGMSDDERLFKAPILSFSEEGVPKVRYFRVYIESAHKKANSPLAPQQVEALNVLDTVLDQSWVQQRVLLEPGQALISADDKFLHTRTNFVDASSPVGTIRDTDELKSLNRFMLRMWMRRN